MASPLLDCGLPFEGAEHTVRPHLGILLCASRVMASERANPRERPAHLWRHVKVRDVWLFDVSALVVEVNDGKPYCIVPRYSSYLIRSKNSIINYCTWLGKAIRQGLVPRSSAMSCAESWGLAWYFR